MHQSDALLTPLLAIIAGLFTLAALLILVAGWRSGPRLANRLWIAYLTEFAILAAILVPAYVGVGPLLVSLLAIGLSLYALYWTLAVVTAQFYRVSFLLVVLAFRLRSRMTVLHPRTA